MSKKTKTYPSIVRKIGSDLGSPGTVIFHEKTEENPTGQSGMHTFADDMINIVLNSKSEADAFKRIQAYLWNGSVIID